MNDTTARMTIEVEVHCGQGWSERAEIEQVRKQAIRSGLSTLRKAFESNPMIRIVGKPKIKVVCSDLGEG